MFRRTSFSNGPGLTQKCFKNIQLSEGGQSPLKMIIFRKIYLPHDLSPRNPPFLSSFFKNLNPTQNDSFENYGNNLNPDQRLLNSSRILSTHSNVQILGDLDQPETKTICMKASEAKILEPFYSSKGLKQQFFGSRICENDFFNEKFLIYQF